MYLYYMNKLEKIQNPKTGKWFNINSKTGKMVLENYINILHMEGGARSPAALRQEEQLRKKRLAEEQEQQAMANRAAERARVAGKRGEVGAKPRERSCFNAPLHGVKNEMSEADWTKLGWIWDSDECAYEYHPEIHRGYDPQSIFKNEERHFVQERNPNETGPHYKKGKDPASLKKTSAYTEAALKKAAQRKLHEQMRRDDPSKKNGNKGPIHIVGGQERQAARGRREVWQRVDRTVNAISQRIEDASYFFRRTIWDIPDFFDSYGRDSDPVLKQKLARVEELLLYFKTNDFVTLNKLFAEHPEYFAGKKQAGIQADISKMYAEHTQVGIKMKELRGNITRGNIAPIGKTSRMTYYTEHHLGDGNDFYPEPVSATLREAINFCERTPACGGFDLESLYWRPDDLETQYKVNFKITGGSSELTRPDALELLSRGRGLNRYSGHVAYVKTG